MKPLEEFFNSFANSESVSGVKLWDYIVFSAFIKTLVELEYFGIHEMLIKLAEKNKNI